MFSDASSGYYKRNARAGVPGAGNVGMRQVAGLMRSSAVAPNVTRLNSQRQANSGASPLAQIGIALKGAVPTAGPPGQPYLPPSSRPAPRPPMPSLIGRPGGLKQFAAAKRPIPRRTPFIY